ncbi:MAG: hypothetical protein IJV31_10130 [Clostridia bacterium]|nr:hypothetical protein [Clostridia bacterium]
MALIVFFTCILCSIIIWDFIKIQNLNKKIIRKDEEIRKINVNNSLLKDWLIVRQNGINLADWLEVNGIHKIVIYGYGILGKAFFVEMQNSNVEVVAIADKNYKNIYANVPAVGIDSIPECDAIIVSVINYYDEIEQQLVTKCRYPIISLEDVIYGVGYKFDE